MRKGKAVPKKKKLNTSDSLGQVREASSEEERRVWRILEQAQENVRSATKRELEAEIVSGEVMNFRLKS